MNATVRDAAILEATGVVLALIGAAVVIVGYVAWRALQALWDRWR